MAPHKFKSNAIQSCWDNNQFSLRSFSCILYIENVNQPVIQLPDKIVRKTNPNTIPAFCKLLQSTKWTSVTNEKDPQIAFDSFFENLNSARDVAFPEIRVKQRFNKFHHSPWMSKGLMVSKKHKERLFSKKKKKPSVTNEETFKIYNTTYNKLRRLAKKLYYQKQFNKNVRDSKQTWSLIREIIGTKKDKNQFPDFFKDNGQIIRDNLDIANGFNKFFAQIGPNLASDVELSDVSYETFLPNSNPVNFQFERVSEVEILRICRQLKPKLSSGIDYISNKLLIQIAPIIITPLHYLINLSLETGFIPKEMKIAKIVPIFKDGDCHNYTNYRPISLISSFAKLLEKIVSRQMNRFLDTHNILYKHQYGFRAKHNTSQPVLHFVDNIYNALNQKNPLKI